MPWFGGRLVDDGYTPGNTYDNTYHFFSAAGMDFLIMALEMGPKLAKAQAKSPNPYSGDEQAIKEGGSLFRGICAVCHGRNADGKGERGQGSDLRKFKKGYTMYLRIVKNGRVAHRRALSAAEVRDTWRDPETPASGDFYYLRVTETDGNMAWTSPIHLR